MNLRILKNGHIYTGAEQRPWARALAVVGRRIAALDDGALAWQAAPGADVEDLDGATVIPGLIDAHVHLMWYALGLRTLRLRGCTRAEMLEKVQARASETPPGTWIRGRGWDQNLWSGRRFPTAAELDRVAPAHPVLLIAKNGHAAVVNTAALRQAGITAETPDLPAGRIGRDAAGEPNGMLFEHAVNLVSAVVPQPSVAQVADALREAQAHLLDVGLTGVHDVDAAPAFAAFQALHREDALRVRVVKYVRREALRGLLAAGVRSGFGDDWLRLGGLKLYADGALGARTGALFAPYKGEPDNLGILTLEPEELTSLANEAVDGGLALAIHAIGDRANRLVLDVLETVRPRKPALRHRVEHVQLIRPEDVSRFKDLNVVASMQPVHATHDHAMADRYWGERTQYAYAWRTLLDAGAPLAFGSDAPIERFDPWAGLYAAVTRRHEVDGSPGPEGWHPEQRLSLREALHAFTTGTAYAAGMESELGRLLPGYLADLLVLNHNIFALPPEALLATKVRRLMIDGLWRTEL
jgi:predicted amidohydrolase YtcJ